MILPQLSVILRCWLSVYVAPRIDTAIRDLTGHEGPQRLSREDAVSFDLDGSPPTRTFIPTLKSTFRVRPQCGFSEFQVPMSREDTPATIAVAFEAQFSLSRRILSNRLRLSNYLAILDRLSQQCGTGRLELSFNHRFGIWERPVQDCCRRFFPRYLTISVCELGGTRIFCGAIQPPCGDALLRIQQY